MEGDAVVVVAAARLQVCSMRNLWETRSVLAFQGSSRVCDGGFPLWRCGNGSTLSDSEL